MSKKEKQEAYEKKQAIKPAKKEEKEIYEGVIRIMQTDIPETKNVYTGLTKIKGISWGFSNALCNYLKIDKSRKMLSLNPEEIIKITEFIKNPKVPSFLLNRKLDRKEGTSIHKIGADLDLNREFDIKRLKQIRSYRGLRHALGQPTRGQRTKSHFRKNKSVGVMNKPKVGKK